MEEKEILTTETVRITIQNYDDRSKIIVALANNGYKVWIEEISCMKGTLYYVCFEPKRKES